MKVALVHDFLSQDGGAERLLKALHELWPEAPIFVLFHDRERYAELSEADVRESFIRFLPFGRRHYKWYLPWMPLATERHNLHDFDVVISSSSAFAKGVLTRPDTLHISYCHTPTRYLWTDTHEYIEDLRYSRLIKAFLPKLIHRLRLWDKMSADRVDHFIANSQTVRHRISKYYRRESSVIYPPVDTHLYSVSGDIQDYFVSGGRLVPYKRFDLLVQVFNRLKTPLKIFGTGPERNRLQGVAKSNIEFLGKITDDEKVKLLRHARAFIHPQVEDLGITPIESMAAGRPVIAYGVGGVTETVIPGETGVFFKEQSWESILDTVLNFDHTVWDQEKIHNWAQRFGANNFKRRLRQFVEQRYEEFRQDLDQCRIEI